MNRYDDPRDLIKGVASGGEPETPAKKPSGTADVLKSLLPLVPGQLGKSAIGQATAKMQAAAGKAKKK